MLICSAPACPNPVVDGQGHVCCSCLGQLNIAVYELGDLDSDLNTTITRQSRSGPRVGPRSAEGGLPFNTAASDIREDLRNVLATWIRDLWNIYGPRRVVPTGETTSEGTPLVVTELDPLDLTEELRDMGAWLLRHPSWITMHPAAGELVDEILDAIGRARRVIDLPPELLYCGPCSGCGTDLYAPPERAGVICRDCDTRHEVAELRAALLNAARNQLSTATEIARALPALLGHELSPNTVRTWAHNGRLARREPDERGRPRYLVGEVIDLALSRPSRVTRKREKCA